MSNKKCWICGEDVYKRDLCKKHYETDKEYYRYMQEQVRLERSSRIRGLINLTIILILSLVIYYIKTYGGI